jgi:hypothetical protein
MIAKFPRPEEQSYGEKTGGKPSLSHIPWMRAPIKACNRDLTFGARVNVPTFLLVAA